MNPQLTNAIELHRAGRLVEAQAIYRQVLADHPDDADAHHLLGLAACQTGHLESSQDLITRALILSPGNVEFLTNLGEVQRRLGRNADAVATFQRVIAAAPNSPPAHYNLAVALTAAGQVDAAVAAYRGALAIQPSFAQALNNLGILLSNTGQFEQSAVYFRQALALNPQHAEVLSNLGLALWRLDRHEEAVATLSRAVQLKPQYAPAQINLAYALRRLGRHAEAVAAYQRAAGLMPQSANVHRDLAQALLDAGETQAALAAARRAVELAPRQSDTHQTAGVVLTALARNDPRYIPGAIAAYERALELEPHVPEWQFELANLRGITPATAPDAYVTALFDEYALRFDQHLVQGLHYSVPQGLLELVQEAWAGATPPEGAAILDLGCGTGLCGELFRPFAGHISGVDLSPKMVSVAKNRRDAAGKPIYDDLHTGHLLPILQQHQAAFDLILAGDVLIYVGALDDILAAVARALRPGGLFAFSLERHDGPEDFVLHHRYRHHLDYVRRLYGPANMTERCVRPFTLRTDVPPGWLVLLQKPAASME